MTWSPAGLYGFAFRGHAAIASTGSSEDVSYFAGVYFLVDGGPMCL